MPNYRRFLLPGGTYFFTVVLRDRRSDLLTRHIDALRVSVRETRARYPFLIDAWTVLPEHMHFVLTLPENDHDFSNRIKAIKTRFSRRVPPTEARTSSMVRRGERGIWQRRFWEHAIRDQEDYERHVDYVHFNAVKHGHVSRAHEWPWSTFHRWVDAGVYARE